MVMDPKSWVPAEYPEASTDTVICEGEVAVAVPEPGVTETTCGWLAVADQLIVPEPRFRMAMTYWEGLVLPPS